uniref:Uncharacterized protein n=1 Tax=Pithovirus LCPAC304 TaxID=2506594 RepID=A0A481Z8R7_9VIRU|nr:MAG: hypothetical protein LCPAC304_06350 [Pithovirus LCPAC304]
MRMDVLGIHGRQLKHPEMDILRVYNMLMRMDALGMDGQQLMHPKGDI